MSRAEPKGSAKDGRRRRAQDQGAGRCGGGPLCYDDSTRVNLGLFQHDVNVIWDQAPHDLSIMDYLIGLEPDLVVATGGAHSDDTEDMAYITLYLP